MHALKIETASIQKYIFSSNKLKVNLGASYIIEHLLYKELLKKAVGNTYANLFDEWFKEEPDLTKVKTTDFGIGYIGGGNALLYGEESELIRIEKEFKKSILQAFPGLEVYTGRYEYNPNSENEVFKEQNTKLNEEVKKNRSKHPFINFTPNHGFYNKCTVSGDVALEEWQPNKNEKKEWVSDEVKSKIQYGENLHAANKKHEADLLDDEQRELFTFPIEFDKLSKNEDKKYIAIVHIDGNNLGNAFIDSKKLEDTQKLSFKLRNLGTNALKKTIKEGIINNIFASEIRDGDGDKAKPDAKHQTNLNNKFDLGKLELLFNKDQKERKNDVDYYKLHLPIRPIITGGDDITFVCEGTLGIPLAKLFLKHFHEIGKKEGILNGNVHACAGVAILKQKYPFYRAYELSEQLIQEAKKSTRGAGNNGSYLSFMIAGYGTGTSLEDLKKKYARPDLYCGTFNVVESENLKISKNNESKTLKEFEDVLGKFIEESDGTHLIPRNKLMQVREALINDDLEIVWPEIKSRIGDDWNPIGEEKLNFEAIEALDYYNKIYLQED